MALSHSPSSSLGLFSASASPSSLSLRALVLAVMVPRVAFTSLFSFNSACFLVSDLLSLQASFFLLWISSLLSFSKRSISSSKFIVSVLWKNSVMFFCRNCSLTPPPLRVVSSPPLEMEVGGTTESATVVLWSSGPGSGRDWACSLLMFCPWPSGPPTLFVLIFLFFIL